MFLNKILFLVLFLFIAYFSIFYINFFQFLIISEMLMFFFFFFFLIDLNFNMLNYSIIMISFMIIESCLMIILMFENMNYKKIFFLNNFLMF